MKNVWIDGKNYDVKDDTQIINIMVQNIMEREKERKRNEEMKLLQEENKRLKDELEHKEYQLTVIKKQASTSTNDYYDMSQNEIKEIVDAGSELVAQDAWKIFKNMKPSKDSKMNWTIK